MACLTRVSGIFLLLVTCSVIYGQQSETVYHELDIKVCSFHSIGLAPGNEPLIQRIPMLIVDRIKLLNSRALSEEQRLAIAQARQIAAVHSLQVKISDQYRQRDELFFSNGPDSDAIKSLDREIADNIAALTELRNTPINSQNTSSTVTLNLSEQNLKGELLPRPVLVDDKPVSDSGEFGLMVYGIIEELEGFLFIEVRLFSYPEDQHLLIYQDAVPSNELEGAINTILDELTSPILGRPWATLIVNAEPGEQAGVYINDEFVGLGSYYAQFINPGDYSVSVRSPNRETYEENILLEAGESITINAELSQEMSRLLSLNSTPEGADVYLNAYWQGTTPLTLEVSGSHPQLIVSHPDYYDHSILPSSRMPESMHVNLTPSPSPKEQFIESRRNDFYLLFGLFALSIPLGPIFFEAATSHNIAANQAASRGEALNRVSELQRGQDIFYNLYLGGLIVTASLLIAATDAFFDYIDAVEWLNINDL